MLTWCHHWVFWNCRVFLVKFSYWSKFHVHTLTGSIIVNIFVYKGLTRNWEIRNTPILVLLISRGRSELGIPILTQMLLIKSYWMLRKIRVTLFTAFTASELLRHKPVARRGEGSITTDQGLGTFLILFEPLFILFQMTVFTSFLLVNIILKMSSVS